MFVDCLSLVRYFTLLVVFTLCWLVLPLLPMSRFPFRTVCVWRCLAIANKGMVISLFRHFPVPTAVFLVARCCLVCRMFAHPSTFYFSHCVCGWYWFKRGRGPGPAAWRLNPSASDGPVRQTASCSPICRQAVGGVALGTDCHSPQALEAAAAHLGTLGTLPARLRAISPARFAE